MLIISQLKKCLNLNLRVSFFFFMVNILSIFHTAVTTRDRVPVREFPDYVLQMTKENEYENSELASEYQVVTTKILLTFDKIDIFMQQLHSLPTSSYEVACLPHNIDLNRFRNVYPCKDKGGIKFNLISLLLEFLKMITQE